MVFIVDILIFFLGCVLLNKGTSLLVKSAAKIAAIFRMTEFIIGSVLVALATDLPDTFVGIISSLEGLSAFALGNVIGANVFKLTLIVGVVVLIRGEVNIYSKMVLKNSLLVLLITLAPILLMSDQVLNWSDGLVLVTIFILYVFRLYKQERRFEKTPKVHVKNKDKIKYSLLFVFSVFLLWFSSRIVITTAESISITLGVPEILIGMVMIAFGTSLPELAFAIKSTAEHEYLAIGDILGSVITDFTLVLGISAIIHPIQTGYMLFIISSMFMLFSAFLFVTFVESERNLRLKEGLALIMFYILFLVVEFNLQALANP